VPELPGVEGFRRVAERASGRRIDRVELIDRTLLRGGELRYWNMRKFGGVWISRRGRERVTAPLGPDATEVGLERFRELLGGRRGGVKAALMDQRRGRRWGGSRGGGSTASGGPWTRWCANRSPPAGCRRRRAG
jgi:formamidopyrimidine-DNA glycosylase